MSEPLNSNSSMREVVEVYMGEEGGECIYVWKRESVES